MLTPGSTLGHYEIVAAIGAGGMGEVYRARDNRLQRDVAIKVLPPGFAGDGERLARFTREAQVLASLNHPHIAHVYGIEDTDDIRGIVMELVEGATLAERLARAPLPVEEAVSIARQIADALDAAHQSGIVHRDLKPANIKVTDDGTVKVLDFGLARSVDPALGSGSSPSGTPVSSPTVTTPAMTAAGVILGTAAYMSPEQARGKPVDKRADIWAFGVVLHEMLTGRRLFHGDTVGDTLAEVLKGPIDEAGVPASTSPAVRHLLRRCLTRDPQLRLRDIGDAAAELRDAERGGPGTMAVAPASAPAAPAARRLRLGALVAILLAAAVGLAAWLATRGPDTPARVRRLTIPGAGFTSVGQTTISADGRLLAYVPETTAPPFRLVLRSLDSYEERDMATLATSAANPFFSPDGRWLGYFSEAQMMKVPVVGGSAEPIAATGPWHVRMADWGADGTIVMAGSPFATQLKGRLRSLSKVSSSGGEFARITDPSVNEAHLDPHILPDGRLVLFTVVQPRRTSIAAVPIDGGEYREVIDDAQTPRYSPTGHLLFRRHSSGELMAVPFDAADAVVRGTPTALAEVAQVVDSGALAVSRDGTLIYSSPADADAQSAQTIVSVDRDGNETTIVEQTARWAHPRFSPDGRSVLFQFIASPNCDLWTLDLARGTRTRATLAGDNHDPLWHPSGERLTWSSQLGESRAVYGGRVDRASQVEVLTEGDYARSPESWTSDGAELAFSEAHPDTGRDIWVWTAATGRVRRLLASRFKEEQAAFSPGDRWIAYVSNEPGRDQVYLQPYRRDGARVQISTDGGTGPIWSRDGRELFYAAGSRLMVVDIDPAGARPPGRPTTLVEGPYVWERPRNYDVSPDGSRFLFVKRPPVGESGATLRVVFNWPAQLPE